MAKQKFNIYRFLPVQLFLLHFRKYQLLLVFWLVLFATIRGHFMSHFGAATLFLTPEYLGKTDFLSFLLLGAGVATFTMSWHITTFIIHSKRVPFLGATRHAFVKYCLNNSLLALLFIVIYGISVGHYLYFEESYSTVNIIIVLVGFLLGFLLVITISFLYFFRVDRNILKTVLSSIGSLTVIHQVIPYDSLDIQQDQVYAGSYLDSLTKIKYIKRPYQYNTRFLTAVLRRHHRNAVFGIVLAYLFLLVLGYFMENPILRIPAGASFLLLFSIIMAFVGAFKYFLKSWEIIGWIILFLIASLLTTVQVFDLRSEAYAINYRGKNLPRYDYQHLKKVFDTATVRKDKQQEQRRLARWKSIQNEKEPPIVIISASGGGSRSAYWSFRCLQYADSLSHGQLFKHSVFMTGASGGMIGIAFWRAVHTAGIRGKVQDVYNPRFQKDIGKDLLNAIVFSMATVDFISPFNKIVIDGKRYGKDRGYAFDLQLGRISEGLLNKKIRDYQKMVTAGQSPLMVINGTIINDGRKLMIASQPISYLTRASYNADEKPSVIDAVGFQRFFKNENPMNLKLTSALRMSASFPIIMPVVKLPSKPNMNIMDAGLRDNYGTEASLRYINTFRHWMTQNCRDIIYLQIRDTKEIAPSMPDSIQTLADMILNPLFIIQKKWSSFQTFSQTYLENEAYSDFKNTHFHKILLEFEPGKKQPGVALNFHLSDRDKQELKKSIYMPDNQEAFHDLIKLLTPKDTTKAE